MILLVSDKVFQLMPAGAGTPVGLGRAAQCRLYRCQLEDFELVPRRNLAMGREQLWLAPILELWVALDL